MVQRNLPSLAALRAFEQAASLGSFKAAAAALNLSTSAVSHQIRALENELGVALFARHPGGVELTSDARQYLKSVRASLDQLQKATESIGGKRSRDLLRISLLSSLSTLWLIPLLDQFNAQYPGIDIELVDDGELADFGNNRVDAAIRYDLKGRGQWRGLVGHPLIDEYVFPVCSPAYLERHPAVVESDWARHHQLLVNSRHPDEWEHWSAVASQDFSLTDHPSYTIMDTSNMTLMAARSGLGVALGRTPFVDEMLRSNQLVRIHPAVQHRGSRHFLVYPPENANRHHLVTFREWLISTGKQCSANYQQQGF